MIEGLSLETATYPLSGQISSERTESISKAISAMDGVESTAIHEGSVFIQYYPAVLSKESMRKELARLGIRLEKSSKTNNPFKRFINRLAESNKRIYGSETLDCCKLNRKQHH